MVCFELSANEEGQRPRRRAVILTLSSRMTPLLHLVCEEATKLVSMQSSFTMHIQEALLFSSIRHLTRPSQSVSQSLAARHPRLVRLHCWIGRNWSFPLLFPPPFRLRRQAPAGERNVSCPSKRPATQRRADAGKRVSGCSFDYRPFCRGGYIDVAW